MVQALRMAMQRFRSFLDRDIKVKESLPPYLLIGVLWWLNGISDDNARATDARINQIQVAITTYDTQRDLREKAITDREACIGRVESRQNMIDNWHANFEAMRVFADTFNSQSLRDFAINSKTEFDSKENNQPLSVEEYCKDYQIPPVVEVPPILIEEGIVSE